MQGKVSYIHLRNVVGKVPRYQETFIDEGDVDMVRILDILDKNLFGMLSDIYPSKAVASITGLTGIGAAIAGAFAAAGTGYVLQITGSYLPILIWASISYLVVLAEIHLFIPTIHRIEVRG